LFRKDIKQPIDTKYMHFTKMAGIMIIVKIKREFLIIPFMILQRIVQMKIDINLLMLEVNINLLYVIVKMNMIHINLNG